MKREELVKIITKYCLQATEWHKDRVLTEIIQDGFIGLSSYTDNELKTLCEEIHEECDRFDMQVNS